MFRRTRGSPRPKPWLLLAAIVRSAAAFGFGFGHSIGDAEAPRHFLRPAQQPGIEAAARDQHVVKRFADVLPPSRMMLACAIRRIISLMKAALTPFVRCAASATTA